MFILDQFVVWVRRDDEKDLKGTSRFNNAAPKEVVRNALLFMPFRFMVELYTIVSDKKLWTNAGNPKFALFDY